MKKYLALVSVSIAAVAMLGASPAMARNDVDWAVTVGSGGGYPPPVVYSQPRVIHEHVRPVIVERRTIVRQGYPHEYHRGHRHGHYRHYDRHERHDHDRHERRHDRDDRRYYSH
jgi:hypothetical protein